LKVTTTRRVAGGSERFEAITVQGPARHTAFERVESITLGVSSWPDRLILRTTNDETTRSIRRGHTLAAVTPRARSRRESFLGFSHVPGSTDDDFRIVY
jgi:hypothetical protein